MNVLNIDDYRKIWVSTSMVCDFCSKKWLAVHQIKTDYLECPKCGKMVKVENI